MLNDAVATRDTITQLAVCLLRQADGTGPGSSAYMSRTALLTKRRAVRSTNTWLPSVHDGAMKCGLGVIEARLAPFLWKAILDTRVLIADDLGAAPAPLVLAQVECYTRRSAASRHPSRWRGAATSM